MRFAEPNYRDVRERGRMFESIAQYGGDLTTVVGGSEPVRAQAYWVSSDFFNVLGVRPVVGRTFSPDESRSGGVPVAIVSYGFWQRLLGGRSDFAGQKVRLLDQSVTVIGVMPSGSAFPADAEIWIPRELFPQESSRSAHNWSVVARLRPNITLEQARNELSAIGKRLKLENGSDMDAVDLTLVPQQEFMVGN